MEDLATFIKRWSVMSKTSGEPQVAKFEDTVYVFLGGYPMTYKGFVLVSLKVIFGDGSKMSVASWEEFHKETIKLCEPINIKLIKEREAFTLLKELRNQLKASERQFRVSDIPVWLERIVVKIKEL